MPGQTTKVNAANIRPYELIIGGQNNQYNWRPGVISFVQEDRLPIGAVTQAKNMMMTQDGVWATRWGSNNYGKAYSGPITGMTDFTTIINGVTTNYIMIIDNGTVKYSKDGGNWSSVSGTGPGAGNHLVSTNQGTTYLSAAITTTTATSITVASATNFPSSGSFIITVDSEQMNVTAGAGTTTWTVTRGVNGTTKATHSANAVISYGSQVWTQLLQYQNKILFANGVDNFGYIDISTSTISGWVGTATTTNITSATATIGSQLTQRTNNNLLRYYITTVTKTGETAPYQVADVYVDQARETWWANNTSTQSSNTNVFIKIAWTGSSDSNVIGYNIYLAQAIGGVAYFLDSISANTGGTVTYTDWGSTVVNNYVIAPVTDTTLAPKFNWMAISDNRLWATGDPNNPNRIYWAGAQLQYALGFSPFVGGGWVDIQPGTPNTPRWIGQFRDGQGNPITTILMAEPSGYGSVWHCMLTDTTFGNYTFTTPTVVQAMQSFGTLSPRSVVQTLQNVYYYSPGPAGFYSNGSIQTLYNVLATNEISLVIRPDCKAITYNAINNITGIEFDKKIFWSVPYGSSQNNQIFVYDTAKQNWNPAAFTFGVQQFMKYTDNSGVLHLLALQTTPINGNYLIEINANFNGDNGLPFDSHIQTGLIHVSPDHLQFANIQYAYWEMGSAEGQIQLAFSGTTKNTPLSNLATYSYIAGSSANNTGFSSFAFSTEPFSYASVAPTQVTQLADKKRIRITKLVNNWEAEVHTNTVASYLTLNQMVVKGFMIPTQDPTGWILN